MKEGEGALQHLRGERVTRGQKPQGLLGNTQRLLFHFHWQVRLRCRFPSWPPLPLQQPLSFLSGPEIKQKFIG